MVTVNVANQGDAPQLATIGDINLVEDADDQTLQLIDSDAGRLTYSVASI